MRHRWISCLFVSVWILLAAPAGAEETRPPHLRVGATATASGLPDLVEIDLGVVTQGKSAEAVSADNAGKVDAVLKAVRKVLGADADVRTIGYSVNPLYDYEERRAPKISGYAVSNVLRVRSDELPRVNRVIDAAMQAGANNVQSLRFSVKDEQALRAEALRDAIRKARAEAATVATAMDVRIVRVLAVDVGQRDQPVLGRSVALSAESYEKVATPIEAGTIEVEASVTLELEIGEGR